MSIAILGNNELRCGSAEREILLNWINILFTQIAIEGKSAGWINNLYLFCCFLSILVIISENTVN